MLRHSQTYSDAAFKKIQEFLKMKRKKIFGIFFVTVLTIATIVTIAVGLDLREDRSSEKREQSERKIQSSTASLQKSGVQNLMASGKNTKNRFAVSLASTASNESNEDTDDNPNREDYVEPTEGIKRYRIERERTIAPIYWEELINTLEDIFQNDIPEPNRTRSVSAILHNLLTDDFSGSSILSCQCGIKLCKVTMLHDSKDEYERFGDEGISGVMQWSKSAKSGKFTELDNGRIESRFYVSRNDNGEAIEDEVSELMYRKVLSSRE
jgi:hypothetical protein